MVESADDPDRGSPVAGGNATEGLTPVVHPLRQQATHLPLLPGVYRFLAGDGQVLYVGKAKALRQRVLSYFRELGQPLKTRMMLVLAKGLTFTVTNTESQALILEANLIKELKPRFNVLYKDDKSYPYLYISDHPFPRLTVHRGPRREEGWYFGPYPSVQALRESLKWLQQVFPIRQCEDEKFRHRSRPCLQYQIHRCGGPCCGRVEPGQYADWVREIKLFFEGRDTLLLQQIKATMWAASEQRAFETAARIRDRLLALIRIREEHRINLAPVSSGEGERGIDLDGIGLAQEGGRWAIQVFFIRGGLNLGNRGFIPEQAQDTDPAELLESFLTWFYADHPPPAEILLSLRPQEEAILLAALTERREGKVRLTVPKRGIKRQLVAMAEANARHLLLSRIQEPSDDLELLAELANLLDLPAPPQRIEAYDISHSQDEAPVGVRIVFGPEGFRKADYRRYDLTSPEAHDDTARMRLMLRRRLLRLTPENQPGLFLLDGGLGQLHAVLAAVRELNLPAQPMVAMAKGEEREAGRERLFLPDRPDPIILPEHAPVLHLLQRVRDEAHRFAITSHRRKRALARRGSILDRIPGIGAKRKRLLLVRFGSVKAIRQTSLAELMTVDGISQGLAARILGFLQADSEA